MSTYDHIRCEMPLPEPQPPEGTVFITRDTPTQFFDDYTITADGRLIHHGTEEVPDEERSSADLPDILRGSTELGRSASERDKEIPYNGDLTFQALSSSTSPAYVACFIDGRCVRILTRDEHKRLMEFARRLILMTDLRALNPRRVLSASDTPDDIRCILEDEFAALNKIPMEGVEER